MFSVGQKDSVHSCVADCYKRGANGVTVGAGTTKTVADCQCNMGQSAVEPDGAYMNCVLRGL